MESINFTILALVLIHVTCLDAVILERFPNQTIPESEISMTETAVKACKKILPICQCVDIIK